jgi:hypothetical protein
MSQQKSENYPKFWFGFALGAAVCGLGMAAVGTKQGREALKKTMQYLEDVEDTPDQVHKIIDAIQEITGPLLVMQKEAISFEEKLFQAAAEPKQQVEVKKTVKKAETPEIRTTASVTATGEPESIMEKIEDTAQDLSNVIDRMRSITASEKNDQKFFKVSKK